MRPTRILHRAGNVPELLHLVRHPAVDAIEADVWESGGRFFTHHERPVGPLLLSSRTLTSRTARVPLEQVLEAVQGRARFIIDLRSWFGDPSAELARMLRTNVGDYGHIEVTCESWRIADRLRAWLPDLRVTYSIRSESQLRQFLGGVDSGEFLPTPVTVRHTLLITPGTVEALHRRAGSVGAWTVDDADRALELKAWGVDQIVSNYLTVLNTL